MYTKFDTKTKKRQRKLAAAIEHWKREEKRKANPYVYEMPTYFVTIGYLACMDDDCEVEFCEREPMLEDFLGCKVDEIKEVRVPYVISMYNCYLGHARRVAREAREDAVPMPAVSSYWHRKRQAARDAKILSELLPKD